MSKYSPLIIRKLPNGKYCGILKYKDAKSGKWRQVTKTAKEKLKRDARVELAKWEKEMNRAAEIDGASISPEAKNVVTVEQVVSAYLQHQLDTGELERSTFCRQKFSAETRVYPFIGKYVFEDIDRIVIQKWLSDLAKEGLKQGTIQSIWSIPNKVYNYYERIGEISHNPFKLVQPPKKSEPKTTFLEPEQVDELLDALNSDYEEGDWLWTAVNIALLSGLRRGEICGLRWYDIDLKRGYISVSTAVGQLVSSGYTKAPKNKSSIRSFPMVPQLIEVLEARKAYVKKKYGTVDKSWFVIGDTVNIVEPRYLGRKFNEFVKANNLTDYYGNKITLHSLRHNIATLAVRSNVDIASLSKMLGHASKALTLDVYADASPEAMKLASERLTESISLQTEFLDYNEETDNQ